MGITDIIKNWRYGVLMLLFAIGTVGVLSMPETGTMPRWIAGFVMSKAVGAAAICAFACLLKYWWRRGEIDELTRLVEDDV